MFQCKAKTAFNNQLSVLAKKLSAFLSPSTFFHKTLASIFLFKQSCFWHSTARCTRKRTFPLSQPRPSPALCPPPPTTVKAVFCVSSVAWVSERKLHFQNVFQFSDIFGEKSREADFENFKIHFHGMIWNWWRFHLFSLRFTAFSSYFYAFYRLLLRFHLFSSYFSAFYHLLLRFHLISLLFTAIDSVLTPSYSVSVPFDS